MRIRLTAIALLLGSVAACLPCTGQSSWGRHFANGKAMCAWLASQSDGRCDSADTGCIEVQCGDCAQPPVRVLRTSLARAQTECEQQNPGFWNEQACAGSTALDVHCDPACK